MSGQLFYFGTQERMTWVLPPSTDVDLSKTRWSADGVYLNGGAYVLGSATGSKRYNFSWDMVSQSALYEVLDYADGIYGSDLIYFLDPFAATTNVLPQYWAAPRLAAEDAPTLVKYSKPTLLATAANVYRYPTMSAVYTLLADSVFATLWVPIPSGYTFHFGAHGSASGTAKVTITPDGGSAVAQTLLGVTTDTLTNYSVTGVTGVTISVAGVGTLTLSAMIAQVLPSTSSAPTGDFISGRGHSGCRFVGPPSVSGYSAPSAIDKVSASAVLAETGAWESN